MFGNLEETNRSNKIRAESYIKRKKELEDQLSKAKTEEEKYLISKKISKLDYNFNNAW